MLSFHFLKKYPLQSSKNINFLSFCEVARLVDNKAHLTEKGLDQIRIIKNKTNTD